MILPTIKGSIKTRYFGTTYQRFLGKSLRKTAEAIVIDLASNIGKNAGIDAKKPSSILITTPLTAEYYRHSTYLFR
jgi:hypothetical protein